MNRRQFLGGLIAGGTAAVIAEFGVSPHMAEEVLEELAKDAKKDVFLPPKTEFFGNDKLVIPANEVWLSTADIRQYYAEEAGKALARKVDDEIMSVVRRMQHCIDQDLKEIDNPDAKVILNPPRINVKSADKNGRVRRWEMVAGAKPSVSFIGTDLIEVGYLEGCPENRGGLVDHTGHEFV